MRLPFKESVTISQGFGNKDITVNGKLVKDYYSRYGLIGHNGIDYPLKTGTQIYAPHNGEVLEAAFDETGYGKYIKIESDIEGSVLAHLQSITVQVGYKVREGDIIGYSNNSGASTGPHLHWGYYRIPRDRTNGTNGFIDQTKYISTGDVYIPKAKIGYEIKPAKDIPVGKEPGKESFNYGKISPTAFAKIIDIKQVGNVFYYNIDQTYIGGGTGWVVAEVVDKTPLLIVETKPVETPEEPTVELTYEKVLNDYNIKTPEELNTILDMYLNSPVKVTGKDIKLDTSKKELTVPIKFNMEWLISLLSLDKLFKGGDK